MPRLLRSSILLFAGVLGFGGLAAPAHADPYAVAVSSAPGVIFTECTDQPINYAVTPPEPNLSWKIELAVQAPDGTSAGSVYIYNADPIAGIDTQRLCAGDDLPGTYTVTGNYTVTEFSSATTVKTTVTPVTPFTFDMRLPYTKVTAKASTKKPKIGKSVKVKVKVADERPAGGFFGTNGAQVRLQRLKGSKWVGVAGTKASTSSSGSVQLRFRQAWKGKTKFRVLADLSSLGKAASSTFVLRSRR